MAKPRLDDPLTADQLRQLLTYDPQSGNFRWRWREPHDQYGKTWNTRYAGQVAGTPTIPKGYVQILLNGYLYLGHRLAYLWMKGEWPPFEIDHRDHNPANNAWKNLRRATSSQQRMNALKRSDNTSGVTGVWYDRRRTKWIAEVIADGKKHHIGQFATLLEAKAARDEAAKRLHGEFARHD